MQEVLKEAFLSVLIAYYCVMTLILFQQSLV